MRSLKQVSIDKEKCIEEILLEIKSLEKPESITSFNKKEMSEEEYEEKKVITMKKREEYIKNRNNIIANCSKKYKFEEINVRRILSLSETTELY
jgi:hypothetical protein